MGINKSKVLRKICPNCNAVNDLQAEYCLNAECGKYFNEDTKEELVDKGVIFLPKKEMEPLPNEERKTDNRPLGKLCPNPKCGFFNDSTTNERLVECEKCDALLRDVKKTIKPIVNKLKLMWLNGNDNVVLHINLSDNESHYFGREFTEDSVILNKLTISRKHIEFYLKDNDIYIVDKSKHGTWFQGEKMKKNDPLRILPQENISLEIDNILIKVSCYAG